MTYKANPKKTVKQIKALCARACKLASLEPGTLEFCPAKKGYEHGTIVSINTPRGRVGIHIALDCGLTDGQMAYLLTGLKAGYLPVGRTVG